MCSHSRSVRSLVLLVLLSLFWSAPAAHAKYYKKWIWTKKEERKLRDLEKDVELKDNRHTLETEHWLVQSTINERFTAELALFMEIFYDVFVDSFGYLKKVKDTEKQTVIVFASADEFNAHNPMPGARGYYSPGSREIVTYMEADRLLTFGNCYHPVIQHEGTHALFHRFMGGKPIPAWLNEGMATFYEYWDYRSDGEPTGSGKDDLAARRERRATSSRKYGLRDYLRKNGQTYPRLEYVVSLNSHAKWNVDGMGPVTAYHYGLAESVSDFLLSYGSGRKLLDDVFERLQKAEVERTPEGFGVINAELVTKKELKKFEKRWWKFLLQKWGINCKKP